MKKIPAVFYRTAKGAEPVRNWLKDLPIEDRRVLGTDIAQVEFGWPMGMPRCRSLGGGLWEVRSRLSGNRISRVVFCLAEGKMVLLHGFVKKTQKTPSKELEVAKTRQKEVENG